MFSWICPKNCSIGLTSFDISRERFLKNTKNKQMISGLTFAALNKKMILGIHWMFSLCKKKKQLVFKPYLTGISLQWQPFFLYVQRTGFVSIVTVNISTREIGKKRPNSGRVFLYVHFNPNTLGKGINQSLPPVID